MKLVDKDNDVIYQLVKDEPIAGGETLRQRLLHSMSEAELSSLEQQLPLLTILVPTLPGGFSPESWEASSQVPLVAVRRQQDNRVPIYNEKGEKQMLEPGMVPGFPVLVVKQNERVVVDRPGAKIQAGVTAPFFQGKQGTLRFMDKAYDGLHPEETASNGHSSQLNKNNSNSSTPKFAITNRVARMYYFESMAPPIAGRVVSGWKIEKSNPNTQWQRDYVYYGISPTTSSGRLKSNFKETIRTFRLSNAGITKMSGQADDPMAPTLGTQMGNPNAWMDGQYEFLIVVLYNPKDGQPPQTNVRFSASPSTLYTVNYQQGKQWFNYNTYTITSVTPKELALNAVIATWDLNNFGTAWNYHIFEENQTVQRTEQQMVSTTYAANFSFDISFGDVIKVGPKFGASASTTNTRTVTVVYTTGSTDLGEMTTYFYDPIIIGDDGDDPTGYTHYTTYELAPGGNNSNVYLSVEPYSVVDTENGYY